QQRSSRFRKVMTLQHALSGCAVFQPEPTKKSVFKSLRTSRCTGVSIDRLGGSLATLEIARPDGHVLERGRPTPVVMWSRALAERAKPLADGRANRTVRRESRRQEIRS